MNFIISLTHNRRRSVWFFAAAHKHYTGPKSNLTKDDGPSTPIAVDQKRQERSEVDGSNPEWSCYILTIIYKASSPSAPPTTGHNLLLVVGDDLWTSLHYYYHDTMIENARVWKTILRHIYTILYSNLWRSWYMYIMKTFPRSPIVKRGRGWLAHAIQWYTIILAECHA